MIDHNNVISRMRLGYWHYLWEWKSNSKVNSSFP